MSGKGNQQQETPQQVAMMQFATNQFADYKKRWLPLQTNLAKTIVASGAPDSTARHLAEGKASTDTAIQFSQAQGALESSLARSGAAPGSARSNLATAGMGLDEAKATGMGSMITDQHIDEAYTQGLSALTAIGRGDRASVASSLSDQAQQSARQAQADATASLEGRMGDAGLIGQLGGYGLQQGMSSQWGKSKTPENTTAMAYPPGFN